MLLRSGFQPLALVPVALAVLLVAWLLSHPAKSRECLFGIIHSTAEHPLRKLRTTKRKCSIEKANCRVIQPRNLLRTFRGSFEGHNSPPLLILLPTAKHFSQAAI